MHLGMGSCSSRSSFLSMKSGEIQNKHSKGRIMHEDGLQGNRRCENSFPFHGRHAGGVGMIE